MTTDVLIIGAGLAGLAAAAEAAEAGRRVVVVDQEPEQSLGGQAVWAFGGLFLVDTPEQRRLGVRDSRDLAWQDWEATAGFDRPEDAWPRRWAEAYVDWAAGEKRAWLRAQGVRLFPVVGWAERGGGLATGPGNSVPRFHIVWGTGPGLVAPFVRRCRAAEAAGLLEFRLRHRVTGLTVTNGRVTGATGEVLAPSTVERGAPSSRDVVGPFDITAGAVVVASGGIGANLDLVRKNWPARLGTPPDDMLVGVPDSTDGRMIGVAEAAGAAVLHPDRMWHYTEGIQHYDPVWSHHGIRILPGPSPLWLDATGRRLPVPCLPGFDTLATLGQIARSGLGHSWFVLTQRMLEKEIALSGSEQNPDLTGRSILGVLGRARAGVPAPVEAFRTRGAGWATARSLPDLVRRMNAIAPGVDLATVEREVLARDREMDNAFTKDLQIAALRSARAYVGDKLIRVAAPHKILDPDAGPLVAVRLRVVTRKTLGGLATDLEARALDMVGAVVPGLFAAGEAAGFGGGGMHGYRSLEGTFLGGCLFSGRAAGRAAADVV